MRCFVFAVIVFLCRPTSSTAQQAVPKLQSVPNAFHAISAHQNPPDLSVVSESSWRSIDQSIDRGLKYLRSRQGADGSIQTISTAKPAVTALYAMAAISAGHEPGVGVLGNSIDRAVDFILNSQCEDGLISQPHVTLSSSYTSKPGQIASYNHGICGTLLGEVYGMTDATRAERIKVAIEKAIPYIVTIQGRPLQDSRDRGGWRYIRSKKPAESESDLSVTS